VSDQSRWPAGTPVAPGGRGPGGGRFRERWADAIVYSLTGHIPVPRTRVAVDPQIAADLYAVARYDVGAPSGVEIQASQELWEERSRWWDRRHDVNSRLRAAVDDTLSREQIMERAYRDAGIDHYFEEYVERNGITDPEAFKRQAVERMRQYWAGMEVAIRITPTGLERMLGDRRFRTVHETGRSGGLNDADVRARHEAVTWGYLPEGDPRARPVYGYLMDRDRPAGDKDSFADNGDALSQYGRVQVVLRSSVRQRTTAMYGDSLDMKLFGEPSPVDDPDWRSWTFGRGGIFGAPYMGLDRDNLHTSLAYIEAQVHGGVESEDIERVIFTDRGPPAALRRLLEEHGIGWSVVRSG